MALSRLDIALGQNGLDLPEAGEIAVLRANETQDYSALPADRLWLFNSFRPAFDALEAQGHKVAAQPDREFAAVIVHVTRSKAESLGLVGQAFSICKKGGIVVVDGARKDGIDSVLKHCRKFLEIDEVVVKHHGRLFWMTCPDTLPEGIRSWEQGLELSRNRDGYLTAPGMFSSDHIDAGSALLAEHFDDRLSGDIADLGAGWGWLALQALEAGKDGITRIDLYEAEARALDAAKANITDERAQFFWSDVTRLAPAARYDAIICNPPFHQGRAATPSLGLEFITTARKLLKPGGSLWLVANRQLPYENTLAVSFAHITPLAENTQFKALLASKPIAGSTQHGKRTSRSVRRNR